MHNHYSIQLKAESAAWTAPVITNNMLFRRSATQIGLKIRVEIYRFLSCKEWHTQKVIRKMFRNCFVWNKTCRRQGFTTPFVSLSLLLFPNFVLSELIWNVDRVYGFGDSARNKETNCETLYFVSNVRVSELVRKLTSYLKWARTPRWHRSYP